MLCYLHESIQAGCHCHCHCKYKQTEFHFICRPQSYRTDYWRNKIGAKLRTCSWSLNKRELSHMRCLPLIIDAMHSPIYQTNKLICSYATLVFPLTVTRCWTLDVQTVSVDWPMVQHFVCQNRISNWDSIGIDQCEYDAWHISSEKSINLCRPRLQDCRSVFKQWPVGFSAANFHLSISYLNLNWFIQAIQFSFPPDNKLRYDVSCRSVPAHLSLWVL